MARSKNTHEVGKGDTLIGIARDSGLTLKQLLAINPRCDTKTPIVIGQSINIKSKYSFEYDAEKGDNLPKIARKFGVTLAALETANRDLAETKIHHGDKLNIPIEFYEYRIKKGDFLIKIAEEQGGGKISLHALRMANPEIGKDGLIKYGEKIRIPTGYYTHVVKPGDILNNVKDDYGISLKTLTEANTKVPENYTIYPGDVIRVPSPRMQLALARTRDSDAENYPASSRIDDKDLKAAWEKTLKGETLAPVKADDNDRPLIVIDLGHGCVDRKGFYHSGAISKDGVLSEVDVVDTVGDSLAKKLREAGYQVAFTRNPGEVFALRGELNDRLKMRSDFTLNMERTLKAPYTVFVSLHANGSRFKFVNGYQILYPDDEVKITKNGKRIEVDEPELHKNSHELAKNVYTEMKTHHENGPRWWSPMEHRSELGIFNQFSKYNHGHDATVLVELGYLSNPKEKNLLNDMRDKPSEIAEGILKGIVDYVHKRSPSVKREDDLKATFSLKDVFNSNDDNQHGEKPELATISHSTNALPAPMPI